MTLRIGFDLSIRAFNRAGNARYAQSLFDALRAQASHSDLTLVPLALPAPFNALSAGPKRKAVTLFWELVYVPFLLPALCRRHQCDLLHATSPMPLRAMPLPVVATVMDAIPLLFPEWFTPVMGARLRRWLRRTVTHADYLISISENTAGDIQRLFPERAIPITVTHLGSFLDSFEPAEQVAPPHGRPYILSVGTLEPRKNLSTVLEAFARLAAGMAEPPDLVVAGATGWMAGDVERRVAKLGLLDRIRLVGFVTDAELRLLYRDASMLVYPSLYEGFGIPPLEAMGQGCPVISSNVSSLPEVIGDAGLLVDPTSVQQVADAMRVVLEDQELAGSLRRLGHQRAEQFSWSRCARETEDVYRAMLGLPGASNTERVSGNKV
jgi:glycosyltransferase involved in cell wall biosynthesis